MSLFEEEALMLHGLSLMNGEELNAITDLLGMKKPLPTEEAAREAITVWLARTVKCKADPSQLERTVLEWTAASLGVEVGSGLSTDDLERAIRLRIANGSAHFLDSSWTVVCALVALGKNENIARKLDLMERAVSIAVPSRAALGDKRRH